MLEHSSNVHVFLRIFWSHLMMPNPVVLMSMLAFMCIASNACAGESPGQRTGDVKKGTEVFVEICADCHSIKEGNNRKGPSLFGVVGRRAGSLPNYAYSDAIRRSGVTWAPEELEAFLTQSTKLIPGTKMKVDVRDLTPLQRADVIAYLAGVR